LQVSSLTKQLMDEKEKFSKLSEEKKTTDELLREKDRVL
jgi:hypothetical protein